MRTSLEGSRFDVLVIGGGITGAGVARDAAMRGLDVALVEKDDFASGTSSRSSRLVHGGIRYLEYAQVGMVRESVRERETLLRIAPHLVHRLEFTWPVYRNARISRTKLRLAIGVYNFLAGHPSLPRVFSVRQRCFRSLSVSAHQERRSIALKQVGLPCWLFLSGFDDLD